MTAEDIIAIAEAEGVSKETSSSVSASNSSSSDQTPEPESELESELASVSGSGSGSEVGAVDTAELEGSDKDHSTDETAGTKIEELEQTSTVDPYNTRIGQFRMMTVYSIKDVVKGKRNQKTL